MLIDALRYWTSHQRAAPRIEKLAPSRRRFRRPSDSHLRSIIKAVCWRVVGSVDTFIITLLITGSFASAGSIASIETLSKIFLYYLHERAWSKVAFGAKPAPPVRPDNIAPESDDTAAGPLAEGRVWIARPFVGEAARNNFPSPHSHLPQPLVPASREAKPKLAATEGTN